MGAEPGKIQAVVALIGRCADQGYHRDALMREERAAIINPLWRGGAEKYLRVW